MAMAAVAAERSIKGQLLVFLGVAVCLLSHSGGVRGDDPDGLLDFCVAVLGKETTGTEGVWQTGTEDPTWTQSSDPSRMGVAENVTDSTFPCKDVNTVSCKDFVFRGLAKPAKVTSKLGSVVTKASVNEFPAVNTLGISIARIDFLKNGLNPPHEHPRATEVLYVLSGSLLVGFVDTNNTLFQQTLQTGDVFVFPEGLLHFQIEVGKGPASALAGFDSENPGTLQFITALLGSNPLISADVLEAALAIDQKKLGQLEWGVATTLH